MAGLWFENQHPVINTFMKPIKTALKNLENEGNLYLLMTISDY